MLTLDLRRATPLAATVDCGGELLVNVALELATRDYGVLTTTEAVMRGTTGQHERAELTFQRSRLRLDADLVIVGGELRLSGVLTTDDESLPATTATFPAPEGAGGAGDGGG